MSTLERALTAVAIVLSVLFFALTVALQLSISDAGLAKSNEGTSAVHISPATVADVKPAARIVTTGESGSGPTVGATGPWEQPWCTTDHKNPTAALIFVHNKLFHSASTPAEPTTTGSLGKAFRQLFLTLSLFLIAVPATKVANM
ncbi:hypothetical protein WJX82_008187 [Trebouxia sp. C0006]